jgi:Tol biopolymer transport system component
MKTSSFVRTLSFAAFSLLAVSTASAVPTIEETVVSPSHGPGAIYTLSQKGLHLASVHSKDSSSYVVTVDGVIGEPFDQIFDAAVGFTYKYVKERFRWEQASMWISPVAFSPDGTRHAYAGRLRDETVVMLDGKEIFRSPVASGQSSATNLHFTPDSKHLVFFNRTADGAQSYRLMIDGKPATPAFDGVQFPFFSADGSRWGLLGTNPKQPNQKFLIIDGKDAGYVGESPQFTPDGKRVVCVRGSMGDQSLLVDSKPLVKGIAIKQFTISNTGDIGATVTVDRDGKQQVFINGKSVAENAGDIVFSPDGKRWAAHGGLNQVAWIVVDGKKQREYTHVSPPVFSPDSSKCLYVGDRDGKRFVVVNGKEDTGNTLIHLPPIFSESGNGVLYTAGDMMGKLRVYHNEHVEPVSYRLHNPSMSPDGKHFVYYGAGDSNYSRLIVDGVEKVPAADLGGLTFYSPDSAHIAATVWNALWIDEQTLPLRRQALGFSNAGTHLVTSVNVTDPSAGTVVTEYYLNADRVATFSSVNHVFAGEGRPKKWESQPDGSIVFLGQSPSPVTSGAFKRIKVTPAAGSSVATWAADIKTSEERALAEAKAAQEKAAADQLAAAEKAKADQEAALAKRKADYDAAVAAKARAREEAVAAKTKAREEALAAKAKARADALKNAKK